MKKLKVWQTATLAIVLVAGGAGAYQWRQAQSLNNRQALPANRQLVAVQLGNIVNAVTASGTVSLSNKADLNFGFAGTVADLKVKQGDNVTKGQVLARIDSGSDATSLASLQKTVAQAKMNVQIAQENLEKSVEPPYSASDLAKAQSAAVGAKLALDSAQQNLTRVQSPYSNLDIAQAQLSVINAKVGLTAAEDNLAKAQEPYSAADIAGAESAIATARQQLTDAETKAELDMADAEYAVSKAQAAYDAALANPAILPIDLQKAQRDLDRATYNLGIVERAAARSISDSEDRLSQAQQTLADMQAAPDALVVEQRLKQLSVAQATLTRAQDTLADMLAGADLLDVQQAEKKVTDAQNSLLDAQENLAEMKSAVPDDIVIDLKKKELALARSALADAEEQLAGTTIIAPFNGAVSAVNIRLGQTVTANAVAVSVVDLTKPQVDAVVSEADIVRVKQGQAARLTLDGLPGVNMSGSVVAIAVTGKSSSGVVSYPITVELTAARGTVLREGMTATVMLVVQQVNNVLTIPNRAIGGTAGNPVVTVIAEGVEQQRPVTLGLSDGSRTQVLSGLEQGEMVLTNTSASNNQQRFFGPAPAGGGGALPGVRIGR
ncbi:MAG: efflux RND transporter periplasmic adaptor subunit [Chloroflexi bacterium]|nr:efflux RND transporter periplasmic adaptor subunit [Chloroflexota bacterium]